MHDIEDLDRRGVPGGFIATTEFVTAAQAQGDALGFDAHSVFVPHPIQDRTDAELKALADEAYDDIVALIRAS